MGVEQEDNAALSGVRVLDLADEKGAYCTKLLAGMGADVVKIEPLAGDATRRIGPFAKDIPGPERSLFFLQYNTGKRSITLDVEKPSGRELLNRLVKGADVLVETFRPGYLASLSLGYDDLSKLNPRLVVASITPFGQTGPYRDYKSSDLIACALGGQMFVSGDVDTPPLKGYGNQSYHTASNFAAIGVMMALYSRNFSDEGQHLDISLEESMAAVIEHVNPFYQIDGVIAKRQGTLHFNGGFRVFEASNGYALLPIRLRWDDMVAWMESEGMAEDLGDAKYNTLEARRQHLDHVVDVLSAFAKTHTAEELVDHGQLLRLPSARLVDVDELLEDQHLNERGFLVPVDHPEFGGTFKYPGAPYLAHGSPWRLKSRAPRIGEHNREVYRDELGLTSEDLTVLREGGVI